MCLIRTLGLRPPLAKHISTGMSGSCTRRVSDPLKKKHIADVKTQASFVVEIQHSSISTGEVQSRKKFYPDLIWIVDARDLDFEFALWMSSNLVSCSPMLYSIEWSGRSKLLEKWSESGVPVFFDRSNYASAIEFDGRLWWHRSNVVVPVQARVLWRLYAYTVESRQGLIAPIKSQMVIEAVMNGEDPPLCECDDEDAWKFRRSTRAVVGHIDEHGNKIPFFHFRFSTPPVQAERVSSQPLIDDADLPF